MNRLVGREQLRQSEEYHLSYQGIEDMWVGIEELPRIRPVQFFIDEYPRDTSAFGESRVKEGKEVSVKNKSRNKKLAEWSISARALKYVLNGVVSEGTSPNRGDFFSAYKFGAYFAPRYRTWFIYNKPTHNNIATAKFVDGRLIIRYRPNAFYSGVLADIQIENVKVTSVESKNMYRHNRVVLNYEDHIMADKQGEERFRKAQYDRKHNR